MPVDAFKILKCRVRQELQSAADNGYYFVGWNDEEVATDINQFSAELENVQFDYLLRAVSEVRAEKKSKAKGQKNPAGDPAKASSTERRACAPVGGSRLSAKQPGDQ